MQNVPQPTQPVWLYTIMLSVAIASLSFVIPVPDSVVNATATHWRTFASILLTCLFIVSSIVFLLSLRSFKSGVRAAYRLLAFGLLAFSVTLIQFVFWSLFDLWTSDWADSGSGLLPIAIACVLIYAGARRFAQVLSIKTIMNSFWFVVGVTLAASAVMYALAGAFVQYELEAVELYIAICTFGSIFLFFAALLAYKVSKSLGAYYAGAMRWLTIALFVLFVETSHEAINTFWFNNGDVYTDYGYYLIPFVVAGLLMVRASYAFRTLPIVLVTKTGEEASVREEPATAKDYVESITSVVGLVSRPENIYKLQEDLRFATVSVRPDADLSEQDKARLLRTYRSLEQYLIEDDPVRNFTKEEIRSHATPPFRMLIQSS